MPKTRRRLDAAAILAGFALICASAGLLAIPLLRGPSTETLAVPDGEGARPVAAMARLAPAPARPQLAPDEWTSDARALQARLAHERLAPTAVTPPPPPPSRDEAAAPDPQASTAAAAAPALAVAAAGVKDEPKLCRTPTLPLDIAQAAASTLRLRESTLAVGPLDIPPPAPPPEQERRVRLSAVLAEALSQ